MNAKSDEHEPSPAHAELLQVIEQSVADAAAYTGIESLSPRVMAALAAVPRHPYVPSEQRHLAYRNHPLSIGSGQTISQPLIVALMTELLDAKPTDRMLEVGTGSGYQAAVLAQLVERVFTIEIVPALAERAAQTLAAQGITNVEVRRGDGYAGWPEQAPFDGIIVTAAPESIPPALLEQLKRGGKLVIPVGPQDGAQHLLVLEKNAAGELEENSVLPVRFVPLTRD